MSKVAALLVGSALLVACSPPPPDSGPVPVGSSAEPIIGGISDTWRTYVVGVGNAQEGAFCTGTLISRHTVLTAGHCWGTGNEAITRVFFGQNINNGATTVNVAQSVRHPQWDGMTLSHDLTIVHLAADAPSQPVPLLRETMDGGATWIGPNFTFSGYGVSNGHAQSGFGLRRVTAFPIDIMGPGDTAGEGAIDATQFYFSVAGKNTCNGDSGGPSFVARQVVERLNGATSYGDRFCTIDGVDARTDQPEIDNWIQGMIDQFESASDPCRNDGVCDETCNVDDTLVDPDCAPNHCGADGMCVLSCVMPVDPDCTGLSRCGLDGACDPSCPTFDPDCTPLCGADGVCVPTCPTLDPDCAPNCVADGVCVTGCSTPDPDCMSAVTSSSATSTSTTTTSTNVTTTTVSSSTGFGGFGGGGGFGGSPATTSTDASTATTTTVSSTTGGFGGSGGAGGSGGSSEHVHDAIVTSGCGGCVIGGDESPRAATLISIFLAALALVRRRRETA